MLQATLPISRLSLRAMAIDIPSGGSLTIFDRDAHALPGAAADPERTFADAPVVSRALSGATGAGEFAVPGLTGLRFAGYAPVPGFGWAVVVEQPKSAVDRPLGALATRLGGIALLVALVTAASGLIVIRLIRRLERERRGSEAILDSIAEAVVITDPAGRTTSANPAAERLAGWTEEELRGRSYAEALPILDTGAREDGADGR